MIVNWVVTVHRPKAIEKRMFTAFEEAFEYACIAKLTTSAYRVTIKRERREFPYWLNLILASAQQAT